MISAHILDLGRGRPAGRVPIELDVFITGHGWREVGHGVTNEKGRVHGFGEPPAPGVYRLMCDVASYEPDAFFPSITLAFEVRDPQEHYQVAVLLSRFGYSAYRAT